MCRSYAGLVVLCLLCWTLVPASADEPVTPPLRQGEQKVVTPGVRDFKMAELPARPHGPGLDTLFYCSFDESRDADYARGNGRSGLAVGSELAAGKWGRALDCTDQKANMYFGMARNLVPRAGTLECWVKSGPNNIWADGKDHCLFYLRPQREMPGGPRAGVTIELTKRGEDNALHLTVTRGPTADLAVSTAKLAPAAWHHLAFSWDFVGAGTRFWLCVDGKGQEVTLETDTTLLPFVSLQVGNTHWYGTYGHENEFYPFGGLVDELHISDETLARREPGYEPVDTGEIDVEIAQAAEDALQRWLDKWAELQVGGAWGPDRNGSPIIDPDTGIFFHWPRQPADGRDVQIDAGCSALRGRHFLEAYEHTGDERWRQVAVNSAEFCLRAQAPRGYWCYGYVVDASGRVVAARATNWAQIQDQGQIGPWRYLVNMYLVTGDERYFEAATRSADFLLSIENPNGSWPGRYDAARGVGWTTGGRGVEHGCEYNDHATTDPMRVMIAMYHLTGDEKYLKGTEGSKGIAGIGQWMFDTQMGEGTVRGWCQQYDKDNNPVWSRGFEAPLISPRVVNRFIHPMCLWMYLMTGNERYMKLLQETYDWYRAVEVPGPDGGWYYQYLPDGTPATSDDYKTIPIDPKDPNAPKPSRGKLQLTGLERTLTQYRELGPEKFRESFVGSVELTPEDIAARRKSAAGYCRSQAEKVREELKRQRPDGAWVSDGQLLQPYAVATYWYVLNLRLARGVVPPRALPRGGRSPGGMPKMWVADWFDVPLQEAQ